MMPWTVSIALVLALNLPRSASAFARRSLASSQREDAISHPHIHDRPLPEWVQKVTLQQGSVERSYYFQAEDISPSDNLSVMLFFHPQLTDVGWWISQWRLIRPWVQAGEFVAVYLQGHNYVWNLHAEPSDMDDVHYSEMVLDHLEHEFNFKFARVYAIGYSQGAGMVHQLMATSSVISQKLAGYASASCPLFDRYRPHNEMRAIPVVLWHGAKDDRIPVEGGPLVTPSGVHKMMSEQESLMVWAQHDGCKEGPVERPDGKFTYYEWRSCMEGVATELIIIKGLGHFPPSDINIDWIGISWNFIRSHSQPLAQS